MRVFMIVFYVLFVVLVGGLIGYVGYQIMKDMSHLFVTIPLSFVWGYVMGTILVNHLFD